jgi:hypothetical protein
MAPENLLTAVRFLDKELRTARGILSRKDNEQIVMAVGRLIIPAEETLESQAAADDRIRRLLNRIDEPRRRRLTKCEAHIFRSYICLISTDIHARIQERVDRLAKQGEWLRWALQHREFMKLLGYKFLLRLSSTSIIRLSAHAAVTGLIRLGAIPAETDHP